MPGRPSLLLVAASGLAREVLAVVHGADSHVVLGFLDDDTALHGHELRGVPVLGGLGAVTDYPEAELVICAGRGIARAAIERRLSALGVSPQRYATVRHPSVDVPPSCFVGRGSVLLAHVALTADVRVGRHVVIMPNATLTHDDVLEDFATVCAGVVLGGGVRVGECAYLGMGASVREKCTVGRGAVLGMGAALVRDLPPEQTWAGVPAAPLAARVAGAATPRPRPWPAPGRVNVQPTQEPACASRS